MQQPLISIPQPCPRSWAAMSPTVAGRHCTACATEVVDFTNLSDAEILALLAQRQGRPVCAYAHATQLAPSVPAARWRQWLLAALALVGLAPATDAGTAGLPPTLPPLADMGNRPPAPSKQIVVRGQVLDDQDGSPVGGARVIIKDTNFGTVTDEQGRYELVMAAGWEPIKAGTLTLVFSGSPFAFTPQTVRLKVARKTKPLTLNLRLKSIENRGKVMGKIRMPEPPVAPPKG